MFCNDQYRPTIMQAYEILMTLYSQRLLDIPLLEPLEFLIFAILSQRTRNEDATAAYVSLMAEFENLRNILRAPERHIALVVERTTWPDKKAERLKLALGAVHYWRKGQLDLENLRSMSDWEASFWMEHLPDVGRKTAWCVLLFSTLRRAVLPVDTGFKRFAVRYGILSAATNWAQAHYALRRQLPRDWNADQIEIFHNTLKRFVQGYCKADPACAICPLRHMCVFGRNNGAEKATVKIERRRRHSSFQESPWQLEFD